jgi:hypothetical protein
MPIKKNLIGVDEIAIYHFEKTNEGTKVTRLELNENGYLKSYVIQSITPICNMSVILLP